MESEHFYRSHSTDKMKQLYEGDYEDLKIDSALNELGMLSKITNSRTDYLKEQELGFLKEKVSKKCPSNSLSAAPLCVVHMNSDFVTQFSLSKDSTSAAHVTGCSLSDDSLKTSFVIKRKSLKNFYVPYAVRRQELPFKKRYKRQELNQYYYPAVSSERKPDVLAEDRASPPIISRQDSGNKSNPSSPVKSQNSLPSLGGSIFRSRSLDDLEISKLSLDDSCEITSHGEIDTVSQRISKLHVS